MKELDLESELVEQHLIIRDLERQLVELRESHVRTLKVLNVLAKDFARRNDPSVEDVVRCMYG
jgi:uncharacterized coiled-coil protein SlyX